MRSSSILVVTAPDRCDPQIAIAAIRAGAIGVLDLGFSSDRLIRCEALDQLIRAVDRGRKYGVRFDLLSDPSRLVSTLRELFSGTGVGRENIPILWIAGIDADIAKLRKLVQAGRRYASALLLEVYNPHQAELAAEAGFDGVVLKGHESGGRVSKKSSFLLVQHVQGSLTIPFWVQGGMGPDTAAAAYLAGAAGVVLCEQLWLARESPLSMSERKRFRRLDGSETVCVGDDGEQYRFFSRAARGLLQELNAAFVTGSSGPEMVAHALVRRGASGSRDEGGVHESLCPLGQDIALAEALAARHHTVGGILNIYRTTVVENLRLARVQQALAPGGPMAQAHGTKYPIVQGPMTRVSDVAPFCKGVAESGGLPFLALALMRGPAVRTLMTKVREELADRPWGAGILGFVPPELRKEQLEVIHDVRPRFAIVAGGRPSQARSLEEVGIPTYLHVPSRGLLEAFIRDGARKFVFEGRECGGHVGPLGSFSLWQMAIDVLRYADVANPHDFQILFAGGIHDALSAAMVAAAAAPLVARGMKIGVLMGTAYLFTEEAVQSGAIKQEFQQQALTCTQTSLVESGIGHATRCARTEFVDEFAAKKRELLLAGASTDEIRVQLEMFNIGRLRIASKGIARQPLASSSDGRGDSAVGLALQGSAVAQRELAAQLTDVPSHLVDVDVEAQRKSGMYMIGEVATLRNRVVSVAELHREVSEGGVQALERLAGCKLPWQKKPRRKTKRDDLAIVGMGCMFPDSPNLRTYWQNIVQRFDAIREVPPERWRAEDFFSADRFARDRSYSKWGSFVGDVIFDPLKYQIPPASLHHIEPIQLLALEVAGEALRDAGYDRPDFPRQRTSVILAAAGSHDHGLRYAFRTMMRHYLPQVEGLSHEQLAQIIASLDRQLPEWTEDSFAGFLMNVIAGRIANRFDLGGSNFTVDAACAASLAALQTAADQLRAHTCDAALVGAVDGTNNAFCFMCFAKTHALSPTGRSRPFDEKADGIGLGEGLASMVLKRLGDAERDGDQIYAVIRGIGSSSDGRNRSLTAPFPAGQLVALRRAYRDAGISPATVSLIEAHSTGTTVGDRVECEALQHVLSAAGSRPRDCAVGSIKSMIGHAKTAAGMASLIKTALALKHKLLPATIGVETPNKLLRKDDSPLYVNTENRPWLSSASHPRRAGVSAFGFGGTNFHVVLEEYTRGYHANFELDLNPRPCEIFAWARSSRESMIAELVQFSERLATSEVRDLAELAGAVFYDEQDGNASLSRASECRLAIVAHSVEDLRKKLAEALHEVRTTGISDHPGSPFYSESPPATTDSICLLFPGQGSQVVKMLQELVLLHPQSYGLFEMADETLKDVLPQPLSRYIYPLPVFNEQTKQRVQQELNDTRIAQPALAVADLCCYDLLDRYGIRPASVGGHSFGEYVALAVAGVLGREDLLRLAHARGQAVMDASRHAPGAMAAVRASAADTSAALKELGIDAHVANLNGPEQTVIAGASEAIDEALERLPKRRLAVRKIPVTAAFHTRLLAAAAEALASQFQHATFREPTIPVFSNTTAQPFPRDVGAIQQLHTRHLVEPVRFGEQVEQMHAHGARVFIEAGPGSVLTNLVDRILQGKPHTAIASAGTGGAVVLQWARMLGTLFAQGLPVELGTWFAGRRLGTRGTRELVEQIAQASTRKPTDWIVNSSRARPFQSAEGNGVPSESRREAPTREAVIVEAQVASLVVSADQQQPIAEPECPVVEESAGEMAPRPPVPKVPLAPNFPRSPQLQPAIFPTNLSGTSTMNNASLQKNVLESDPSANGDSVPAAADGHLLAHVLSQFGQTMSEWFEIQAGQQRVTERFLESQEKILMAVLQGPAANGQRIVDGDQHVKALARPTGARFGAPVSRAPIGQTATRLTGRADQVSASSPPPVINSQAAVLQSPAANPALTPSATARPMLVVKPAPEVAAPKQVPDVNKVPVVAARENAAPDWPAVAPPTEEFRRDLVEAISQRTGYPKEMLKEDALLEADLGIDSIKTVEIFSSLTKYHQFLPGGGFEDEEESLSEFAQMKTLRDIISSYDRKRNESLAPRAKSGETKAESGERESGGPRSAPAPAQQSEHQVPMQRLEVMVAAAPPSEDGKKKTSHGTIHS